MQNRLYTLFHQKNNSRRTLSRELAGGLEGIELLMQIDSVHFFLRKAYRRGEVVSLHAFLLSEVQARLICGLIRRLLWASQSKFATYNFLLVKSFYDLRIYVKR